MIDEDVALHVPQDEDNVQEENQNKIEEVEKNQVIEERRKTNPKKTIGLIFAGCFLLLLCCCCGYIFFLPEGYLEQTVDDLCTMLESEGGSQAPFGICEEDFLSRFENTQVDSANE